MRRPSRSTAHYPRQPKTRAEIHADYDSNRRSKDLAEFYSSAAWKNLRAAKLSANGLCERCIVSGRMVRAEVVHHKIEVSERPDLALRMGNLESLCHPCHNRHHKARDSG